MSGFGAFDALLAGGSSRSGVPAERLEMIGKKAAARLMDAGIPLGVTIAKEAAAVEGLNQEHVRRMCEFANQDTFNAMFKAAAAEDSRVPNFEVADFNSVMQELGDGSPSTQVTPVDVAYATAPARYTKSAGARYMEKAAAAAEESRPKTSTPHAFPLAEPMALRSTMKTAQQELDSEVAYLNGRIRDCGIQLVTKMAQAFREGHTAEEMALVCGSIDPRPDAMQQAGEFIGEAAKTARVTITGTDASAFTKLARQEVNDQSPVAQLFGSYRGMVEKRAARKLASYELQKKQDEITSFVRGAVSAS